MRSKQSGFFNATLSLTVEVVNKPFPCPDRRIGVLCKCMCTRVCVCMYTRARVSTRVRLLFIELLAYWLRVLFIFIFLGLKFIPFVSPSRVFCVLRSLCLLTGFHPLRLGGRVYVELLDGASVPRPFYPPRRNPERVYAPPHPTIYG